MKYPILLLTLFAFGLSSCMDDDDMQCDGFGEGDTFSLPDGRNIRIVDIDDQLCPCDAVCFWEGQFVVTTQVTGATALDTVFLPAFPLQERDSVTLYGFELEEWDPNLVNYCGGEVPEDELCFTIGF